MSASTSARRIHEFGDFRLEPDRRSLTRGGETVAIRGKPFDALVCLVERAGTLVTRDELSSALWPRTVVEDNNLSQTILSLRRALGDTHEVPRFVATVPRSGYQFIAPVRTRIETPPTFDNARRSVVLSFAGAVAAVVVLAAVTALVVSYGRKAPAGSNAIDGIAASSPIGGVPAATALTTSRAAHALYLQALASYRSHGAGVSMPQDARREAIRRLDEAVALDPSFAAALGWRAQLGLDSLMFDRFPEAAWPRASADLMRRVEHDASISLTLAPAEGTAHVALARLQAFRGQLPEARLTLERALAHRPNDPGLLNYLSLVTMMLDDDDAAVAAARRAIALDPGNPGPYSPLGLALGARGDRDGAVSAHQRMMELAPLTSMGYLLFTVSDDGLDRRAVLDTLHVAERFLDDSVPTLRAHAALSYAWAGSPRDAARLVQEFERATTGRHVAPGPAAMARLAVGDYGAARELLERALATRASGMDPMPLFLIRRNSWRDPVLDEPAWRTLRARLARAG